MTSVSSSCRLVAVINLIYPARKKEKKKKIIDGSKVLKL